MLHEFLTANLAELTQRCRDKEAKRFEPAVLPGALDHGVPVFLEQLGDALRLHATSPRSEIVDPVPAPAPSAIGRSAALHGEDMLRLGFSIDQVVHNYGDICQAITEMAFEQKKNISADEFRVLNRCLDNAIADAVTSYGASRQARLNDAAQTLHDELTHFSDEQRRLITTAFEALAAIRLGNIGLTGATGTLLLHSLQELHALSERTVPAIRLSSAIGTLPTL